LEEVIIDVSVTFAMLTHLKPLLACLLQEPQLVKVVAMKYEIRPPRLCCLKLNVLNPDGSMTKDFFSIKYHDMNDVLDFFVLLQTYRLALDRNWKEGTDRLGLFIVVVIGDRNSFIKEVFVGPTR